MAGENFMGGSAVARGRGLRALVFFGLIAVAACTPAAPVAPPAPAAPATKTITVGFTSTFNNVPFWTALEAGVFANYGLKVEATNVAGGPAIALAATAKGDYQVWQGAMDSFIVYCSREPAGQCPLVSVGAASHVVGLGLYSPADVGVRTAEDLRGKIVGIYNKGSAADYVVTAWLQKKGLKPQVDLQVRSMGGAEPLQAALQQRQIHAGTLTPPASFQALKEGMVEVADFTKEVAPYEAGILIVQRAFLQQNRDVLLNFMKGTYEGFAIAKTKKQQALDAAAKYSGITDQGVLQQTYDYNLPLLAPTPAHSREGVEQIMSVLRSLPQQEYDIQLKPDTKPESFYTDELVQELDRTGFFRTINQKYGITS